MPRKRFTSEQIINKLREGEVDLSRGLTLGQAVKQLGVTEQTHYSVWGAAGRPGETTQGAAEGARLKKLVADLTLDNDILREATSGNY
jgi:putative transposase